MKKLEAKGFTIIEALMVLAVVGIVAGGGWYVWSKQNKTNTTSSSTNTPQANQVNNDTTPQSTPDPGLKWLLAYTSQNNKFSVYIPDGWKLTSTDGYDFLYAWNSTEITYKEGTKAEVAIETGGRDGSSIAFSMSYLANSDKINVSPEAQKTDSYSTKNGIAVDKYKRTQLNEPDGIGIPKGAVEYLYFLRLNDKQIRIVHDVLAGEVEQTKLIEQMIATVKFL